MTPKSCQHAARPQRRTAPSRLLAAKTDLASSASPRSWEDLCRVVSCKGNSSTHSSSSYLQGAMQNDVDRAITTRENNTVIVSKERLCYFDPSASFITSLCSRRRPTTPGTTLLPSISLARLVMVFSAGLSILWLHINQISASLTFCYSIFFREPNTHTQKKKNHHKNPGLRKRRAEDSKRG